MPRFVLLVLFLILSNTLVAEAIPVKLPIGVEGILNTPAGPIKGSVLLLHGWNADMNEVGNLYADLAGQLAERGVASFRISFSGEGARTGYVVSSTFDSRVGEAEAALQFMKEKFPQVSLGVQGYSLGGLTAMGLVGLYPDTFKTMVLWAAAAEMRINGDAAYDAAVRKAMKHGRAVYKDWTDITLTREFISGFVGVNVESNLALYTGALLTIRGDQDFLPGLDPAWLKLAPTDDKAFILMGGADHIFHVLDPDKPGYSERLLQFTANWFDRTL
jgi:pimeloyl-ACP methyl ester carboxylesterase|tara:strand:- start:51 stop:872 length:822 start_codon:yes stop_codon:yes gene_type:complete